MLSAKSVAIFLIDLLMPSSLIAQEQKVLSSETSRSCLDRGTLDTLYERRVARSK